MHRPGKDDDDTKSQMSFSLSDNTSLSCEQTPSSIKHQRVTTPTWKGGNQKQGFPFHLCMWYASQLSFLLSLVLYSRHNKSNHGSGRDNSDIIPLVGCLVQREPSTACSALWWTGKIVEGPSLDIDLSFSPPPWRPPPPTWTNLWPGASQDLPSYMRHILPNPRDRSVST